MKSNDYSKIELVLSWRKDTAVSFAAVTELLARSLQCPWLGDPEFRAMVFARAGWPEDAETMNRALVAAASSADVDHLRALLAASPDVVDPPRMLAIFDAAATSGSERTIDAIMEWGLANIKIDDLRANCLAALGALHDGSGDGTNAAGVALSLIRWLKKISDGASGHCSSSSLALFEAVGRLLSKPASELDFTKSGGCGVLGGRLHLQRQLVASGEVDGALGRFQRWVTAYDPKAGLVSDWYVRRRLTADFVAQVKRHVHERVVDAALCLPLPTYPTLWVLAWLLPDDAGAGELTRLHLIEGVRSSAAKIRAARLP